MLTWKRILICLLMGLFISFIGKHLGWSETRQMACAFTAGILFGIRNAIVDALERANDPGRNNSGL